jgi:hypothetical protein
LQEQQQRKIRTAELFLNQHPSIVGFSKLSVNKLREAGEIYRYSLLPSIYTFMHSELTGQQLTDLQQITVDSIPEPTDVNDENIVMLFYCHEILVIIACQG